MIYARLFCGRGYEFSQLIDVATLETDNDIKIYALFRNYWNMSAVCVYNMTKISTIFSSSPFNSIKDPANHRPGKCVADSTTLSEEVLTFMKERPEMRDLVMPENDPLLFKHRHYTHIQCVADSTTLSEEVLTFMKERPEMRDLVMPENDPLLFKHRHYTHIQVDRQQNNIVLLLSLESGGVHKVLENPAFVIAEYLPFPHGTHITSMLLYTSDSEKRLFVSSSNEVVQIDLKACHVYGDECTECLLSRDPYCGWNGLQCTFTPNSQVEDPHVCSLAFAAPSKTEISAETVVHVPPSSRHFLLCPMTSHHATYNWFHGKTREECVDSDQGCLYLIESMNKTHEGSYICVSSEDVHQKTYRRTVAEYQLSMSRSDAHSVAPIVLPCLLLLLTAPYFLL
ncbi:Semaphorin-7A [Anabarilius grahami]|uniref:Semaphorin-7A n=1 Tax=Anabarilius grahami TaxID=495550 RepID=A0A3N0Y7E5_ANAGA|nr:Semaphorin-7A [Anabarilius grahami]